MKRILAALLAAAVGGCAVAPASAPSYKLTVSSIRSPDAIRLRKFVVGSGDKNVGRDSLEFLEAKGYLEAALQAKGFVLANSPDMADMVVLLSYGILPMGKTSSDIIFGRWLRVEAVSAAEYRKTGTIRSVWATRITSTGTGSDLRVLIPVMIRGAQNYLGEDTGHSIDVTL